MIIRITKEFCFEMAHLLSNYDGLCRNLHGHSYKLMVTVKGDILQDETSPKHGMVMDFSVLKGIVKSEIVDKLDHATLVYDKAPQVEALKTVAERVYAVPYEPTCENMVGRFAALISEKLPKNITLVGVRLYETATSYAEWLAEDNNTLDR
ncbi:MAG: 6-carboxytetrahydropterin synthase [Bacteroidia bacterium]|nr:6-carboxytetrahydropterin synthase [Bacteroidia bacterium]